MSSSITTKYFAQEYKRLDSDINELKIPVSVYVTQNDKAVARTLIERV